MLNSKPPARFRYGHYLESLQDADSLKANLSAFVPFFQDCKQVLDLGCGGGHFVKVLRDAGIEAIGVDADALAVAQADASGLQVIRADVLEFLMNSDRTFDGLFCSHLIEHLPFDSVVDMVEGIARILKPNGVLVMAFPNPESLDMQLFHFWVDPQHVRFYHPTLIAAMLRHYDLNIIETRFRHWREGGTWTIVNGNAPSNGHARNRGVIRKLGRQLKKTLGIAQLEQEVDYLTRLKRIGEEAVIIARKND